MRPLAALLFFAVAGSAVAQSDDPSFKVVVPFDTPYLPLSEFGTIVAKASGVDVAVERAIADRKVAIFAKDRPLAEVMKRTADTMFLVWEKEEKGYRLKLDPEVAKEERAAVAMDDATEREGLMQAIRSCIADSRQSLDAYREAYRQARAEYETALRDQSEAGRRRAGALIMDIVERWPNREERERWDRGRVLGQLNDAQIDALLSGQPFFASTIPSPGLLRMGPDSMQLMEEMGIRSANPAKGLLMSMWYDPGVRGLQFRYRTLGMEGGATSTSVSVTPLEEYGALQDLAKLALVARLNEWVKVKDDAVLARTFSGTVAPPKTHESELWTLSDALRWMHRQTGVPIVADAFRFAAGYAEYGTSGTIADFLKSLTTTQTGYFTVVPPYVRSEGGWLMARNRRFWRRLQAEIPERFLAPLEAKAARTPLTIDDYASLAASISPAQAHNVLITGGFLVQFPVYALRSSMAPLKLWAALPAGVRQVAQAKGMPVANLNGPALTAARAFLADLVVKGFPEESWLPALLPGGEGVPRDTVLTIFHDRKGERVSSMADLRVRRLNESYSMFNTPFEGWLFELSRAPDFRLNATVPLRPMAEKR